MKHIFKCLLFIAIASIGAPALAAPTAGKLLVRNAWLVDPASESVRWGHLLLEAGSIGQIYYTEASPEISGAQIVDANGQWLMPGLHDMHIHNWGDNWPPSGLFDPQFHDFSTQENIGLRYLYAGVTTYLDLLAPNDQGDNPAETGGGNIFELRSREQSGAILHPRIFASGPLFLVKGSHGIAGNADAVTITIRDAAGALYNDEEMAAVAAQVGERIQRLAEARRPDVIKFIFDNQLDLPADRPETMPLIVAKAIIEAARAAGVPSVAHVGTWEGVRKLAELGVNAFTHLPNGPAPADVLAALVDKKVSAITTISIFSDFGDMLDEDLRLSFIEAPFFKLLTPVKFARTYLDPAQYSADDQAWVAWGHKHNEVGDQAAALNSLAGAGVTILSGSDSGNTGAIHGYSLHRELIKMEQAGLGRWAILKAATANPARFLRQEAGEIKEGYRADLVLLRGNPIEAMANTQRIEMVIHKGMVIDRDWPGLTGPGK